MFKKIIAQIVYIFSPKKPKSSPPVIVTPPVVEIPESDFDKRLKEFQFGPSAKMREIKDIAIIIGHGHGDPGALGKWSTPIKKEFEYNKFVAEYLLANVTSKRLKLFYRGASGIAGVNGAARAWGGDLSLELHCNAFDGNAHGCVMLALSKDTESIKMGQDLSDDFCRFFKRKKRDGDGVVEIKSSDRGHYSLLLLNDPPPSILLESFFIDNVKDWTDPIEYAKFLKAWIDNI